MKKICYAVLLSLLFLVALTACNSSTSSNGEEGSESGKTEITYYSFSAMPNYEEELNEMVVAFEKENPDIKVNVELAPYDDYFTKLQTRIAGNNPPDVFELNYENFVQYASRGTLADLTKYIEEDESFDPSQLNEQAFKAYQYEGKQFGMVESFSNVVLFYNKDLFDKAGLDYPTADWTWEDELEAAKKLSDPENHIWGTYAPVTMNEYYKVAAQNGGMIFDKNGNVSINSPENVEALKYMIDKVITYKVSPSPEDLSGQSDGDLFKNGQIAMLHTGIWMFDAFKDAPFEWDIQLEPGNTQKAHHFFANGLAVSTDSEHKEAAYKFASFMSASEEAAKIRIESSWELPAITNEDILAPYFEQTPPENREVVFEALNSLVLPPAVKEWSKISDMTNQEFEKALLGDKTPQEVLETLDAEYKNLLGQ
ncbi:ABC transporter substrate-binding protein [Fervidibacillus albus]|uniref:Sugar ABC transporter substrate-binding protein n=1 Tax=Fervidibacillus albus TaxID=2980026 RepID=A0A9E8LSR6_9BACI|nr:sugar ABC transporter substrate-binding protein [Fervidibacillus albus]WAA08920.1 sugar ABC transporter substrate-binding protein [Fervidibacillus albus]